MIGDVEIDPSDDALPCAGFKADSVMAFAEHLHEFAGVRVVFQRVEEMVIALGAGPADEGMQSDVG